MSRPFDILHVMPSLAHGGAEQNLLTLLRQLPRDRYRNHLVWLGGDEALKEAFRPHVETMFGLGVTGRIGQAGAIARLASWVHRHRPDVIHAQMIDAQLVARLAGVLASRPVVTTWQCVLYHDVVDFGGSRAKRGMIRLADLLTGLADRRVIAVSEYVAAECSRDLRVGRDRIEIIYNALDPERIAPSGADAIARTRSGLDLPENARVMLSVARLHPQKGHADLIDAMPEILARVPDAVLLVAGRGPLESSLRERADKLGVSERVRLLGARRDVATLYQLADLFVFPSYYEGLSVALVEALGNGLPAVVSDIPQNREVGDGLAALRFVPTGDSRAIAAAAAELLTGGPAIKAAAAADRDAIRERFSAKTLAARFAETLERAALRKTENHARAS